MVTIKKYYTLIITPFFLYPMGNSFVEYVKHIFRKETFMKWNHFIINKINEKLELPQNVL